MTEIANFKRIHMMKIILPTLVALTAVFMAGCESTTGVETGVPVTFSARLSPGTTTIKGMSPETASLAPDSIRLTRVRILLRDVRFESTNDTVDYRSLPMAIDLQGPGVLKDVYVGSLPPGMYDRIRFRVHRIEDEDLRMIPPVLRPEFEDFLAGDRYSIIVDGIVFTGGASMGENFTYRSRIDEEQRIDLDPALSVSETSPVTVTMTLDTGMWFRESGGMLLDPRLGSNENTIDDNMKASIDLFEDNDRNGFDD